MNHIYLRGEIYYADLDPVVGSEQMGTRPVLILQNNVGNHFARTVIIAPITSRVHAKSKLPIHSYIGMIGRMKYLSVVMLEQLRTLDKRRIGVFLMGNSCVYAIDMVKLRCGWFNPSDIYKIGGSVMFRFMQKQSGLSHFGFWPSPHLWTGQLKIYHVGA